jgi:acyl-homoserine-lactone acylase
VRELAALYGDSGRATPGPRTQDGEFEPDPSGSNGIAIAPRLAANRRALLWINPHTSFYFRSELQMVSEEGLNAYGAVTWGQFFIYQGFNATAGWMHTSSGVDNIDEFFEPPSAVLSQDHCPIQDRQRYHKDVHRAYTQHGPVVRKAGDRLVSVSLMWQPINALIQSYSRTKARNLPSIARSWSCTPTRPTTRSCGRRRQHRVSIPTTSAAHTSFDWTAPVDGSNPATSPRCPVIR